MRPRRRPKNLAALDAVDHAVAASDISAYATAADRGAVSATGARTRPGTSVSIARTALVVFAVALVVSVVIDLPFLRTYVPFGDDPALVLHSTRFFSPSPADWVENGYRGYNQHFPELATETTNFLRPTTNASVYLDSWVASRPTSPWLLTTNYVGHALTTALVFLASLWIFGLRRRAAVIAAAVFFGSVSASTVLMGGVAYRGDMLAGMLSLAALLVADRFALCGRARLWPAPALAVLLTLALFAKEAAVAAPFVIAVHLWFTRSRSARPADDTSPRAFHTGELAAVSGALVVPLVLYAVARLQLGTGGTYVQQGIGSTFHGVPKVVLNPFRFLFTCFLPIDPGTLKDVALGSGLHSFRALLDGARSAVALAVGALAWLAVVAVLRDVRLRRSAIHLLALALLASAIPIVLHADPRFMYFSQTLFVPLLVWLGLAVREKAAGLRFSIARLTTATLGLLLVVGPMWFVADILLAQPALVSDNHLAASVQRGLLEELANPSVRRLYFLNVPSVSSPGLETLRFAAAIAGRHDVTLREVDKFEGDHFQTRETRAGVRFRKSRRNLVITTTLRPGQHVFGDLDAQSIAKLGQPGVIEYSPITRFATNGLGDSSVAQRRITFAIPDAARADIGLLGLDPRSGRLFLYDWIRGRRPLPEEGHRAQGAGRGRKDVGRKVLDEPVSYEEARR
jgi:hypothetical protein